MNPNLGKENLNKIEPPEIKIGGHVLKPGDKIKGGKGLAFYGSSFEVLDKKQVTDKDGKNKKQIKLKSVPDLSDPIGGKFFWVEGNSFVDAEIVGGPDEVTLSDDTMEKLRAEIAAHHLTTGIPAVEEKKEEEIPVLNLDIERPVPVIAEPEQQIENGENDLKLESPKQEETMLGIETGSGEYVGEIKKSRKEKFKNTALETARTVLGNKVVQGYLRQSRLKKWAINTALFTGIAVTGSLLGGAAAGTAAVYGGYRIARGVVSLGASGVASKFAYKKAGEELAEREKNVKDQIDAVQDATIEEKENALKAHQKYFGKEKTKMAWKKAGVTILAGAGAGALAGLAEHAIGNFMNSAPSMDNSLGGSTTKSDLAEKIAPKEPLMIVPKVPEVSKVSGISELFGEQPPSTGNSIAQVDIKAGDSVWKSLTKILEKSEKFSHLTQAEKLNVVANFNEKVMENPRAYHLRADGSVLVGDKLDFTKLFEDSKEVESIFDKAANLSSTQATEILQRTFKIKDWTLMHPHEALTPDKVKEILAGNPAVPEAPLIDHTEHVPVEVHPAAEPAMPEAPAPVRSVGQADVFDKERIELRQRLNDIQNKSVHDPGDPQEIRDILDKMEEMQKKIETIKLPNQAYVGMGEMGRNTAFAMGAATSLHLVNKAFSPEVMRAFDGGVDKIYGDKPWFREEIKGESTKAWLFMSKLPAVDVLLYNKSEEEGEKGEKIKTNLSKETVKELSKSKRHIDFMKEMAGLAERTNIKPGEKDTVEVFMKKLIQAGMEEKRLINKFDVPVAQAA